MGNQDSAEGDGKILKPEGWQAPEPQLRAEIERQRQEAEKTARIS